MNNLFDNLFENLAAIVKPVNISLHNVSRKKIELLHKFNECKTIEDFTSFNNAEIKPLHDKVRILIDARCKAGDFTPVTKDGFYFSDFNYLHDATHFLEDMHYDCLAAISEINFDKNGWTSFSL